MDSITSIPTTFINDGSAFINKCTKPDKKEFVKIIKAVGVGFIMMGVVGYVVKLIHIPVRYLIV